MKARVTFYGIKRCGYYKHGEDDPAFCNVSALLLDFQRWLSGKEVSETKTFEIDPDEESKTVQNDPTYCLSLHPSEHGDWLLRTWNEFEDLEDQIVSIPRNSRVGTEIHPHTTDLSVDDIHGYPGHFYFIPSQNVIAVILLDSQKRSGHKNLDRYLESYLAWFSSHVVARENSDEYEVLGYRETEAGATKKLRPSFHSKIVKDTGEVDLLRHKYLEIRKVIKKNVLRVTNREDRSFLSRMMSKLWTTSETFMPTETKLKFSYKLDFRPTLAELNAIISDADTEDNDEDVGFILKGAASKVHWLSHSLVRADIDVDVRLQEGNLVDPDDLLRELNRHRAHLISLLP